MCVCVCVCVCVCLCYAKAIIRKENVTMLKLKTQMDRINEKKTLPKSWKAYNYRKKERRVPENYKHTHLLFLIWQDILVAVDNSQDKYLTVWDLDTQSIIAANYIVSCACVGLAHPPSTPLPPPPPPPPAIHTRTESTHTR